MAPRNQINEKISVSDFILPVENLEVSHILLERERTHLAKKRHKNNKPDVIKSVRLSFYHKRPPFRKHMSFLNGGLFAFVLKSESGLKKYYQIIMSS
jgi:hypothetical protein